MYNMTLKDFLHLIQKRWYIVMLITSFFAGVGYYMNFHAATPIYSNTCTLLVNDKGQRDYQLSFNDLLLYEKLLGTYKDVIRSKKIISKVAERIQPPMSAGEIAHALSVSTNSDSQVITITAEHSDQRTATNIVNLVAEEFKEQLPGIMNVDNVQILDRAVNPEIAYPIRPNKTQNMIIVLFLGVFVSIAIIVLRRYFDNRIRYEEDLLDILPYPMLGTIPSFPAKGKRNKNVKQKGRVR